MGEWLSLQRSLFRRQQRELSELLEEASPQFQAYERRYLRRTRRFSGIVSRERVLRRLKAADVVYVGDYHTFSRSQQTYLKLVHEVRKTGRRVVMALEFVEGRHQPSLQEYLRGTLPEAAFLEKLGRRRASPHLWPGAKRLFKYARRHGLQVVGIDRRAQGPRSLELRDAYAAKRIARASLSVDRPLVAVLMGQFHVLPKHLPRWVRQELGGVQRKHLIFYQNCEGLYWNLAARGRVRVNSVVELSGEELCLFNASPLAVQQTFLDYLYSESALKH